ncbi:MAG: urease accessory protein UreE [Ideonella sp.]|nr:urease accessory protein UreE [Ideonella sp.]
MLTVNKLIARGRGLAPVLLRRAATVALDWDTRQKSRFDATDSQGRTLGVFLPRGHVVRGVRVEAAPQPVLRITPCAAHGSPFDLLRAAYHLGNRHVSIELAPDHLQIEPDPVLAEMLDRMHLIVTPMDAAFEPEGGAYAATGHDHGHAHHGGHHHAHDHAHGHDHAPAAVAAVPLAAVGRGRAPTPVPHVHGPGCGHDHGHDHGHPHTPQAGPGRVG